MLAKTLSSLGAKFSVLEEKFEALNKAISTLKTKENEEGEEEEGEDNEENAENE